MQHHYYGATLAVVGALALWNCGGGGTPTAPTAAAPAPGPATVTANIVGSTGNTAFNPNPVRAGAGDTVMFRNNDSQLHHIVLDNGSADLGLVGPGATTRGLVLANVSELLFHCVLHPSMVGSINGQTAPESPYCDDPLGYEC